MYLLLEDYPAVDTKVSQETINEDSEKRTQVDKERSNQAVAENRFNDAHPYLWDSYSFWDSDGERSSVQMSRNRYDNENIKRYKGAATIIPFDTRTVCDIKNDEFSIQSPLTILQIKIVDLHELMWNVCIDNDLTNVKMLKELFNELKTFFSNIDSESKNVLTFLEKLFWLETMDILTPAERAKAAKDEFTLQFPECSEIKEYNYFDIFYGNNPLLQEIVETTQLAPLFWETLLQQKQKMLEQFFFQEEFRQYWIKCVLNHPLNMFSLVNYFLSVDCDFEAVEESLKINPEQFKDMLLDYFSFFAELFLYHNAIRTDLYAALKVNKILENDSTAIVVQIAGKEHATNLFELLSIKHGITKVSNKNTYNRKKNCLMLNKKQKRFLEKAVL